MKAFAIVFGVIGVVFLAYVFEPRWIARWIPLAPPSPPPVGSFRVAAIPSSSEPGSLFDRLGGRVGSVVVDYQGSMQLVELVVENWDGEELISTSTVLKQPFGSNVLVKRGNTTFGETHHAFSHTRERFSIWLEKLPEPFPDGRNALASVVHGDPSITNAVWSSSDLVDVVAFDESRGNGSTTQFDWSSDSEIPRVMLDSEELVLWRSSTFPTGAKATYDPPYGEGVLASRLVLRFVKE